LLLPGISAADDTLIRATRKHKAKRMAHRGVEIRRGKRPETEPLCQAHTLTARSDQLLGSFGGQNGAKPSQAIANQPVVN